MMMMMMMMMTMVTTFVTMIIVKKEIGAISIKVNAIKFIYTCLHKQSPTSKK